MRSAAVLGEFPTCSRRASTSLLRSSACQPGRSGRLPRVVPATAPPSSPSPPKSLAPGGTATTTDALPYPRANANATQPQPAPPQNLQAAAAAAPPQTLTSPSPPSSYIPAAPASSATPPSMPVVPSASLPSAPPPPTSTAPTHANFIQDSTVPSSTIPGPPPLPTTPATSSAPPAALPNSETAATIPPHTPTLSAPPPLSSSPPHTAPPPSPDADTHVPSSPPTDLDASATSASGPLLLSPHDSTNLHIDSAQPVPHSPSSPALPAPIPNSTSSPQSSAGGQLPLQQQPAASSSVVVTPAPGGSPPSSTSSSSTLPFGETDDLNCDNRDTDMYIPAGLGPGAAPGPEAAVAAATAVDDDPASSSNSTPPAGPVSSHVCPSAAVSVDRGVGPTVDVAAMAPPPPIPSPPSPRVVSAGSGAGSGGAAAPHAVGGDEGSGGGEASFVPHALDADAVSTTTTAGGAASGPSSTFSYSSPHPTPPPTSGTPPPAAAIATGTATAHRDQSPSDPAPPTAANGIAHAAGTAAAQNSARLDGTVLSAGAGGPQGGTSPANTPTTPTATPSSPPNGPSPATPPTPPPLPNQPHPTAPPHAHPPNPTGANPITAASSGFQLRPMHVVIFAAIFLGGALFAALTLQFTADLDFQAAAATVARRVARSVAFRQLCVIACAICLVRFGLNNVLRALARFSANPVQWDKSKVYYILKEVYQPLELLLFIAAICTIADSFVPQLIAVPRTTVSTVVRSTLSVSFIIGAATVVFNLKSRFCKENAWQSEMNGDVTAQRRWEAYDKLGTFIIYAITFVLGIQALGLEVTSVLAIGGIGGLAIGLAGREICENILNGFLIMSTSPFEVGDEVHFFHSNKVVEGIVLDIGWYRTTIRSYEREVFVIPNAVFSKNIVLNITRKNREWRFFEMICVRVQDVHKVNAIIQDIRRIVRNDQRIITKLHRRIFLDKLTHEDCRIYVSFYVEAQNRESFMAVKQDLLLAFVDCVERNGAKLAVPRTTVQMEPDMAESLSPLLGAAAAMAAAKVSMDVQAAAAGNAAAAAARALTDGRTITAEVTTVPSSPSPSAVVTAASSQSANMTTNGNGGGSATTASSGKTPTQTGSGSGSGGGSGGVGSPSGKSSSGGATSEVAVVTSVGVGAAAVAQGSHKGNETGGTGVTWILSKLAQMLFET